MKLNRTQLAKSCAEAAGAEFIVARRFSNTVYAIVKVNAPVDPFMVCTLFPAQDNFGHAQNYADEATAFEALDEVAPESNCSEVLWAAPREKEERPPRIPLPKPVVRVVVDLNNRTVQSVTTDNGDVDLEVMVLQDPDFVEEPFFVAAGTFKGKAVLDVPPIEVRANDQASFDEAAETAEDFKKFLAVE